MIYIFYFVLRRRWMSRRQSAWSLNSWPIVRNDGLLCLDCWFFFARFMFCGAVRIMTIFYRFVFTDNFGLLSGFYLRLFNFDLRFGWRRSFGGGNGCLAILDSRTLLSTSTGSLINWSIPLSNWCQRTSCTVTTLTRPSLPGCALMILALGHCNGGILLYFSSTNSLIHVLCQFIFSCGIGVRLFRLGWIYHWSSD